MGKRWRHYQIGPYRLGYLKGQAVATYRDAAGKKHRDRLGTADTEAAARSLLAKFVREKSVLKSSPELTVASIFDAYRNDRRQDGKKTDTFDYNWQALAPYFGHIHPDVITADLCRSYTAARIQDGRSQGTVWTELTRLRSSLNWAQKRRVITAAPYVWIPQKPPPKERVLSQDEFDRIRGAAVMPHVRLFIVLGMATGARTAAILELKWSQVDMATGVIDLRRKEPPNPLLKVARKGRAIIPINDRIRGALSEAYEGRLTDYVIEWNGERVKSIRKGFQEACRRAGIADVTPHTLRHSAASWMASAGEDMERIARYLGHSDPAVTRSIYAKPDPSSLNTAAAIVQLPKRASVQRTVLGVDEAGLNRKNRKPGRQNPTKTA